MPFSFAVGWFVSNKVSFDVCMTCLQASFDLFLAEMERYFQGIVNLALPIPVHIVLTYGISRGAHSVQNGNITKGEFLSFLKLFGPFSTCVMNTYSNLFENESLVRIFFFNYGFLIYLVDLYFPPKSRHLGRTSFRSSLEFTSFFSLYISLYVFFNIPPLFFLCQT